MKICLIAILILLQNQIVAAQEEDPFKDYDINCAALLDDREMTLTYYNNFVKSYGIKDGETVADIGGASGWKTILHVILKDMTNNFYIEDIDTGCLNEKNFNKVVKWYTAQSNLPVDDSIRFVIGDEKSTHLPKNTFDRAILDLTFHEITYKKEMLDDIKSILKKDGILVIVENISRKPGKKRKDCGHDMPTEKELTQELTQNGFKLYKKTTNVNQKGLVYFEFVKRE